jgi:HMG (high mobility group) box
MSTPVPRKVSWKEIGYMNSALSISNRSPKSVSPLTFPLPFFDQIAISGHENVMPNQVIGTSSSVEQPVEPPKPPRSAFMCYTDSMKEEIVFDSLGNQEEQLKIVAAKWRLLSDRQRAEWEEVSRQDKVR